MIFFNAVCSSTELSLTPKTDIIMTRLAAPKEIYPSRDAIWIPQRYELGYLVSSHALDNNWKLTTFVVYFALAFIINVLYNFLVLRKRGRFILFGNGDVFAIALNQAVPAIQNRGSKIIVGAIIILFFFISMFYITFVITYQILFVPDRTIQTSKDIMRSKIPIMTESKCLQNKQIVTTSISLWEHQFTEKIAFVEDMTTIKAMLNSASNVNTDSRAKYYLLDELYRDTISQYVLPRNSPFTAQLKKILIQTHETGLQRRWLVKVFNINKELGFRYFPKKTKYGLYDPRPLNMSNLTFPFLLLIFGLIIGGMVFLFEKAMHFYEEKKMASQKVIHRQRIQEGVNEFYEYLIIQCTQQPIPEVV